MVLRLAQQLGVSFAELEACGYTEFDMGVLTLRDTDAHNFSLVDLRIAEQIGTCLFIIESLTDRVISIQPFGAKVEGPGSTQMQYNIGAPRTLPVREQIAIQVTLDDSWFPWMGLAATPALAPSTGSIHAQATYFRKRCR